MAHEETSSQHADARQATVLIVDDDADIRDLAREILRDAGYRTLEAADGVSALEIMQNHTGHLVVLLDILLPQLDGASLLGIAARNHHMAVSNAYVLMTGKPIVAFPVLRQLAAQLGALILPKPFDRDALISAVNRAAASLRVQPIPPQEQRSQMGK